MSSGSTSLYAFPYPLSTDPVRIASDIEGLAKSIDSDLKEIVEDAVAVSWSGGTFSNGLEEPTYNDSTGKMSMSLSQDIKTTASPQFVGLTLTGDIDVQGGDITTNKTSFNLINSIAATINFGSAATTINIGNSAGTINSESHINLVSGKEFKINNVSILSATALGSSVASSALTSLGTISTGTWQGTIVGTTYGGTGLSSFAANKALYSTSTSALTTGNLPLEAGGTNSSLSAVAGGIAYSTATGIELSAVGTAGQVLTSSGSSAPTWSALPGSTDITLSGDATGTGTSAITVTLSSSGVTAGTYGSSTAISVIQVDSKGRVTSASSEAIDIDPLPQILMMAGM